MREADTPWFIHLAYFAPHSPLEPAPAFAQRHEDSPAGRYQALKEQVDNAIGKLLDELRSSGELDNTLVVIVSDNGGTARHWPSNLPFHGVKATYTEGAVRTPLLMSWPGHWPEGQVRDDTVAIIDLYPTILESLGLKPPMDLDGRNLFADSEARSLRWYSHGLELDRYSILSSDGQWRLSAWGEDEISLYGEADLSSPDPVDRATDQPHLAAQLRDDMRAWIRNATEVKDLQREDDNGVALYRGQAFRRTPMGGTHTLGLVLRRSSLAAEDRLTLARQAGYIDISAEGDSLHIEIDGNALVLPLPAQPCFTLFVTSLMAKDNMIFKKYQSETRVFIDGEQVINKAYTNTRLSEASPLQALAIACLLYTSDAADD